MEVEYEAEEEDSTCSLVFGWVIVRTPDPSLYVKEFVLGLKVADDACAEENSVCVASFVRMTTMFNFNTETDATWAMIKSNIWSM